MELGLGVLGLTPAVFWALTPRELDCILRGRTGVAGSPAPLSRGDLAALMNNFPDQG
jgi:uncharacterized phage protein (TIGR02216 family)